MKKKMAWTEHSYNLRVKRVEKKKKWYHEYKESTPCADCGKTFHHVCMDFHHTEGNERNGDKNWLIGKLVRRDYSLKKIQEEIDKCVCLCSNCHRLRHYEEDK